MVKIPTWVRLFACAIAMLLLGGCGGGGYRLQGVVIEGSSPGIFIVDSNDVRLTEPGIPGAVVQGTIDPDTLRRKPQGSVQTDTRGRFALPVGEIGAGMLEYKIGVFARAPGHAPAEDIFDLPKSSKRILVVLPRGKDPGRAPEDFMGETIRQGKQLMDKGG